MPLNKDQLLRYKILNDCFRDTSKYYTMNDLVEKVQKEVMRIYGKQVSKRSVQNDVHLLQYPPYDVEFDEELRRSDYYRYADPEFNLEIVQSLSERELTAIRETVELLRPIVDDVEDSTPLQQYMYLCLQRIAAGNAISLDFPSVAFENNDSLAGIGNFSELAKCIMNHQPLKITYRTFRIEKSEELRVHPYLLKQFNGRWFLIATTDGYETLSVYALDRILDVKLWNTTFKPSNIDLDEYFSHTIGVTITKSDIETIVLKINNSRYPYVETKPFADDQRIVAHDDNFHTIRFRMRINNEFVALLLSFGDEVEVVEPQQLREIVSAKSESMAKKYSVVQKDCTQAP